MGAARNRFYTKLANEVKEAWMEHKTADMYRALKKLTEPKRPDTYENDMEQGAVLKLDGTLTRTPRETQARWTEYFQGLLNQEGELLRCQDPSWISIYSTASLKEFDRPGEEGNTDRFFQGWVPLSMVARDDIGAYDYCSECNYAGKSLPSNGRGSSHYLWERDLWTDDHHYKVEENRVEGDLQGGNPVVSGPDDTDGSVAAQMSSSCNEGGENVGDNGCRNAQVIHRDTGSSEIGFGAGVHRDINYDQSDNGVHSEADLRWERDVEGFEEAELARTARRKGIDTPGDDCMEDDDGDKDDGIFDGECKESNDSGNHRMFTRLQQTNAAGANRSGIRGAKQQ